MQINHQDGETKGGFHAMDGERLAGKMTYSKAGDTRFIIDSTIVEDDYKGQGLGGKLISAAVGYARDNSFTIIPLCPFASAEFKKHPDYSDVLD